MMQNSEENNKADFKFLTGRGPFWSLVSIAVFFTIIIIFAIFHFEETKKLLLLITNADPSWMLIVIILQIFTYILTGAVWYLTSKRAEHRLTFRPLLELSLEQLSINQLIPVGGLAGHFVMVKALKRLGVSTTIAMEVMFVDTLAYHISFSLVTFTSLILLWWHDNITSIIVSLVTVFLIIEIIIVALIWTAIKHKEFKLPTWLTHNKLTSRFFLAIEDVSHQRVFSRKLLIETSLLKVGIFLLDALTLYAIMRSINIETSLMLSFVALVIASVAGAIILSPGGIGGFEAGSVTILVIFGTPLGAAIATTLLLRWFTLWIPLIPGLVLARRDLRIFEK